MSFNAKNLTYESNEPAFLRKLKSQHGNGDSARHERPLARPRKQVKDGEEDDQPTYVVEESQDTLSKAEYEALLKNGNAEEQHGKDLVSTHKTVSEYIGNANETNEFAKDAPAKQHATAIGASTKRRLAKVVGDEAGDTGAFAKEEPNALTKDIKTKKCKKVKLSFDEEPD